jgi:hypothetical protein
MLTAVQFDDQSCLTAGEVGEVGANRKLANELVAVQAAIAQNEPQPLLGDSTVAA